MKWSNLLLMPSKGTTKKGVLNGYLAYSKTTGEAWILDRISQQLARSNPSSPLLGTQGRLMSALCYFKNTLLI